MKNLIFSLSLVLLCTLIVSGCDLAKPKNKGKDVPPVVQDEPAPPDPLPVVPTETVMVKAEAGVGVQGRSLTPATGNNPVEIITAPLGAMFWGKQKIIFDQITHAMNLYKAEHDSIPTSHEEFMEKIIRAKGISLPRLPENHTYLYDPKDGELKVRKPRNAP